MGSDLFPKQFRGSLEKLVMESVFVLNEDPLFYHGLYLHLYEFMEKKCPTSQDQNVAWERFLELVRLYKEICETSRDTMRQRHEVEKPSIHLQKALDFSVNERGGVLKKADYAALTGTFFVILEDLKSQKLKLEGTEFYSLFQILNLFSYTDFNSALKYFWKQFHSNKNSIKKKKIAKNSTVGSFKEAYDLVNGEDKKCILCNEFKRKTTFKFKFMKQHLSSIHAIYSYDCDWDGCKQRFTAWRYLTNHKQKHHRSNEDVEMKADKENDAKPVSLKRKHVNSRSTGNLAKKTCQRMTLVSAKQNLKNEETYSDNYSSASASPSVIQDESGTIKILNLDPNLLHPTCENVIKDLCAIIESYDSSVEVTAPFTYNVSTGILERKVQIKRKVQVPANPVLSSPEQFVPGLSYVQHEVEL